MRLEEKKTFAIKCRATQFLFVLAHQSQVNAQCGLMQDSRVYFLKAEKTTIFVVVVQNIHL